MRSPANVPLHLRLVLANGLVLALAVLAMSLAPAEDRGPAALLVLVVGLALVVGVNTRHLRHGLAPLLTALGTVGARWERERRTQAARAVAVQEYDGQRTAAQLHDDVGQHLAAALVALKAAREHAPPELAAELDAVQHHARLGLVGVHRIGRGLRPEILEDRGLQSALSSVVTAFSAKVPGVHVRRHLTGPFGGLGDETELAIYRTAEAALANVARHARARRVEVSLVRTADQVLLEISDDGVGVGDRVERAGILAMRERAALLGGSLTVTPGTGGGTVVRLALPVRRDLP